MSIQKITIVSFNIKREFNHDCHGLIIASNIITLQKLVTQIQVAITSPIQPFFPNELVLNFDFNWVTQ